MDRATTVSSATGDRDAGERTGQPSSPKERLPRAPTLFKKRKATRSSASFASAPSARRGRRPWQVRTLSARWCRAALPVTRCRPTDPIQGDLGVPTARRQPVAAHVEASQPEGRHDLRADRAHRQGPVAHRPHPSSLARPAVRRRTPMVGARCVHRARRALCGGGSA